MARRDGGLPQHIRFRAELDRNAAPGRYSLPIGTAELIPGTRCWLGESRKTDQHDRQQGNLTGGPLPGAGRRRIPTGIIHECPGRLLHWT